MTDLRQPAPATGGRTLARPRTRASNRRQRGTEMEAGDMSGEKMVLTGQLNSALTMFVIVCVCTVVLMAIARWLAVWLGKGTFPPSGGRKPPVTPLDTGGLRPPLGEGAT